MDHSNVRCCRNYVRIIVGSNNSKIVLSLKTVAAVVIFELIIEKLPQFQKRLEFFNIIDNNSVL